MNEFQDAVLSQLTSFLAAHTYRILDDVEASRRNFLVLEIDSISVLFRQEGQHFLILVGTPSNLNEMGLPDWPLVKLVDALDWGLVTGGLNLEDQCALLETYFDKIQGAFSLEHYPETNLAMQMYGKPQATPEMSSQAD